MKKPFNFNLLALVLFTLSPFALCFSSRILIPGFFDWETLPGDHRVIPVAVFVVIFAIYLIPSFAAAIRRLPIFPLVFLLNFFLGWTLFGWVGSFSIAAIASPPREEEPRQK